MAYYSDLTPHTDWNGRGEGKNVGWLERGKAFETMPHSEEVLDLLWTFCSIRVEPARGVHQCDLCVTPETAYAMRGGARLMLGSAEIRVFSGQLDFSILQRKLDAMGPGGLVLLRGSAVPFAVYAAPNLIYHYVETHHYRPPEEFLRALKESPKPPDAEYFEIVRKLGLEWNKPSGAG